MQGHPKKGIYAHHALFPTFASQVEAAKPPKERREPPPPPPELDEPLPTHPDEVDAFNARMCGAFNDKSLMRCKHCGRSMRYA
eukprot:scaffold14899_cov18-Tisochrysis_lutea.AAC.3